MSTPGILMEPMSTTSTVHQSEADLMSVIVPVVERADDVAAMYRAFTEVLDARRQPYEFVFVFDGRIRNRGGLEAVTQRLVIEQNLFVGQGIGFTNQIPVVNQFVMHKAPPSAAAGNPRRLLDAPRYLLPFARAYGLSST